MASDRSPIAQLPIRYPAADVVGPLEERARAHNRSLREDVTTILQEDPRLNAAKTHELALSWQRWLEGRADSDCAAICGRVTP